jgi:L-seryl-tRNA(Ser) seleniumtransferase
LTISEEKIKERARSLLDLLLSVNMKAQLIPCRGEIGAGSAPGITLASWAVAIPADSAVCSLTDIEQRLRLGSPPVIAYINDNKLIFDLRCIEDDDLYILADAIKTAGMSTIE